MVAIQSRAKMALIFLDACRDNPLAEQLQRSAKGASRSAVVARGLAPMTIRNPDTLLVFAAAPGKTASDGVGGNSPFTTSLLQNMAQPGIEIELMLKRVTRDVVQLTKGAQVPERLSRLTSEFVFNAGVNAAQPPRTAPALLPRAHAVERAPAPTESANCTSIGSALPGRVTVRVGSKLCAQEPPDFAEIREIGASWITYAENNGFNKACEVGQLCRFGWTGSPLFAISISDLGNNVRSAVLLPRRN